jgi:hypothetical protein
MTSEAEHINIIKMITTLEFRWAYGVTTHFEMRGVTAIWHRRAVVNTVMNIWVQ